MQYQIEAKHKEKNGRKYNIILFGKAEGITMDKFVKIGKKNYNVLLINDMLFSNYEKII